MVWGPGLLFALAVVEGLPSWCTEGLTRRPNVLFSGWGWLYAAGKKVWDQDDQSAELGSGVSTSTTPGVRPPLPKLQCAFL